MGCVIGGAYLDIYKDISCMIGIVGGGGWMKGDKVRQLKAALMIRMTQLPP